MKAFWKRSVTTAIVCRELAARQKRPDPDTEMVAGLLCDLGELLLQETFPEKHAAMVAADPKALATNQCALEAEYLETDHAEAGAYCLGAGSWLPS